MGESQRRRAAVFHADVVGYSRLMEAAEAGTHSALKEHRRACVDPKISNHGGRIVNAAGDEILGEFSRALSAVRCALDIQEAMRKRNRGLPWDRQIRFRIGLNLGDVTVAENDDIFGTGVNVAARLQELASPGGIAISKTVNEAIEDSEDFAFLDGGAYQLKNIQQPVHVWHWPQRPVVGGSASARQAASIMADRRSIAVLPFENMSGDPEQQYFGDGMAEDIVTALSQTPGLFVTSRHSSFLYRGTHLDARRICRELGVDHLLEGSVRHSNGRIRINAQLISGESGAHLWAQKYDR